MPDELSFEQLYRELEETVRRLESGDPATGFPQTVRDSAGQVLPLAEAITLFERASVLAEQCNALLDGAELRVRQLTQRADGELAAQPFEAEND